MSINPYESPQPDPAAVVSKRARVPVKEPNPVPVLASFTAIAAAGAVGGLLFLGLMYGLNRIGAHSVAFQAAISAGSSASLLVLLAFDWHYQRQTPAYLSCFLGMLLASPIAYLIAFGIGLYAYGLGTKGQAGAGAVMLSAFFSFFLTLSAAGEMAIRLRRPAPLASAIEQRRERNEHQRLFR